MVLDAVDQLAPDHGAHHLGWLPAPLPPHVRVVLSTLPGATEEALGRRTDSTVLPLGGLTAADGRRLLRHWLAAAGRTLTGAQERLVLDGFARHGRPLWLRLAFEQAQSWSSDAEPGELPSELPDLLRLLFARLARNEARGPTLVGHLLGLIAASGFGLSEPEVIEALSNDPEVGDEVRARAHDRWRADLTGFPMVLWAQLRADLQPYLTEREVDGDVLIDFYHRVLRDVAAADELRPPDGRARHRQLAALFTRAADPDGTGSWRGAAPRAFDRLPRHLEAGEAWSSLTRTLLDLRFLERKATLVGRVATVDGRGRPTIRYGGVHAVRTDLTDLISIASDAVSTADRDLGAALVHALGLEADLLTSRPELMWQQLANRLRWGAPSALAALLDREEARRTSDGNPPWLQLQRPVAQTPGLLHVLRTRGRAHSCALSPDGAVLAGGADDGAALWDATNGAWLADLPGHHGPVHACAFSADGRALYTADESGTLRRWIWDGVRARLDRSRRICHGQLRACAASINHVVVAAFDGLYLCTGVGLEVLARLDESDTVRCCAVDERGGLVAAGYVDGAVRTWRRAGGRVVPAARRERAHEGAVYGCTVDGAGTTVLTAGQDGALRRWGSGLVPLGDPLVDRALPMSTGVWGCAGSFTLDRAVTALVGGAVQVWDVAGATATLLAGHAGIVNAVAMSRDGSIVVSAGYDGTVRLWDPGAAATASAEPFSAMIQALAICSDGRSVLTVDAYGIARLGSTSAPAGETVFATCQTWCMDGAATADLRTLVVVDQAGMLEVWEVRDEPRLRHRLPHDNAAACVLIGHRLAVSAGDDGACHGWDIVRGDRLWTTDLGRGVPVLTVENDQPVVLAASGSGVVMLLDPRTGRGRTLRDSGDPVLSGAIGPNGAIAVGTDRGDVLRWQADEAVAPRRQDGGHDGRVLHIAAGTPRFPFLSASSDGELALWAADASEAPRRWPGHDGPIRRVAVSAADELVVSVSDDKTLRVWTLTGDQQALLPIAGNGQMLALQSTSRLIACGDDGGFVYLGRLRQS